MPRVHICDEIMGKGKTSAFVNFMNDNDDKRFVFITPYLKEVDRIERACRKRKFKRPVPRSEGGRLEDIHRMLEEGTNIVSTHAMFKRYTEETVNLIQANNYILVLDEAFSAIDDIQLSAGDIGMLRSSESLRLDGDSVRWSRPELEDTRYQDVKDAADSGTLILFDDTYMFWEFPIAVFNAFDEVFVLTYMFDAQMMRIYFDMNGIRYDNVYTDIAGGKYTVVDYKNVAPHQRKLKGLVHILDNDTMNAVGDRDFSLSSTWYKNRHPSHAQIKEIKNNLLNYFQHVVKASSGETMWTVYEKRKDWLKGKGYTKGFTACNLRATSEWRDRKYLAYCINLHMNPYYKKYFLSQGAKVDEDRYALSEMVQWIWRSAIREGKEIWIYVPSKRMRTLLENWLDELASDI